MYRLLLLLALFSPLYVIAQEEQDGNFSPPDVPEEIMVTRVKEAIVVDGFF